MTVNTRNTIYTMRLIREFRELSSTLIIAGTDAERNFGWGKFMGSYYKVVHQSQMAIEVKHCEYTFLLFLNGLFEYFNINSLVFQASPNKKLRKCLL